MLIEIKCGNFAGYDASNGEYVECCEKIVVSGDKVGQLVKCPKCHQQIEVPFGIGAKRREVSPSELESDSIDSLVQEDHAKSEASESNRRRSSGAVGRNSPRRRKTSITRDKTNSGSAKDQPLSGPSASRARDSDQFTASGLEDSGELFGDGDLAIAEPVQRPSSDVMTLDFAPQEGSTSLVEDRSERCKKCGHVAKNGRCTVYKHVEVQFEKLHQPMDEISIELAGFQRWFCRTMNEGASIKFLEYGSHVALGIFGFSLFCLAISSLFGIALGGVGGVVMLIIVFAVTGLYVGLVRKGHQFMRDPHAKLAWYQVPFWSLILSISRAMNWQAYDASLKGRRIITMQEKLFGDIEIAGLPGIKNCQVLDLEGTSVTDNGLLELYHLNHLECLVLTRTHVTHEGVFRLQQSCPRLWIWY